MKNKFLLFLYKILRACIKAVYRKYILQGTENLNERPCIIVANHSQMHGPLACELHFTKPKSIWCIGNMMHLKDVPSYAYKDFWSEKPKPLRPFFKLLSYLIAPVAVLLFNFSDTIAVYKDKRIISTFKTTVNHLISGKNVIIFPEHYTPYNHIVFDFDEGFVDIAKLYYKKSGIEIDFVPMYIAPNLKTMYLGKPITYCKDNDKNFEKKRICDYLKSQITDIAKNLPKHTVVPYPNISRKYYPTNIGES